MKEYNISKNLYQLKYDIEINDYLKDKHQI